jgi:hypothetical protein
MEKINCPNRVRNVKVLHRVKEDRNNPHKIKRSKADWIAHILHRNCLLKHIIEGTLELETEGTARQGTRRKQLLNDFKQK